MFLRQSVPLLRQSSQFRRVISQPIAVNKRNIWGTRWGSRWDPFADMRSIVRDMERQFDRDFLGRSFLPKALPFNDQAGSKYLLNLDLSGFKPEDVKLSLKDRNLQVNAKMEHVGNDGSRFYQEISREFLVPDNVDVKALKSILGNDGILSIEAPLPEAEKPREISIQTGGSDEQQQIEQARNLAKQDVASS